MDNAKPFCIAKRDVWDAYKRVKANQGQREWTDSRLSSSRRMWNTISIGCGIDVLRQLLPAAGAPGGHPERREEHQAVRHSYGL